MQQCSASAVWEQWQCFKQMGEEPDMNFTHRGCTEYYLPSLSPTLPPSWPPQTPQALSYTASSSCKSFPAPVSAGRLCPPFVSCGEGQALRSYRGCVFTIWPVKVSMEALQDTTICKYNYVHQNSCLGPWMLRATKTTEMTSKSIIQPP